MSKEFLTYSQLVAKIKYSYFKFDSSAGRLGISMLLDDAIILIKSISEE